MTKVAIIVPVVEEHDQTPYGQYIRHIDLPRVPMAGEWLVIAKRATVIQNIIWHVGEAELERIEVYLTQRPLGPTFEETLNELHDDGFHPMRPDGSEITWAEDIELREAMANGGEGPIELLSEEELAARDAEEVPVD